MCSLILHGKKCIDSHKLCSLRVISVKLLQNAFAFSNSFSSVNSVDVSLVDGSKGDIFSVESSSGKVQNVLTSYGFTDSQISRIIRSCPRLLTLDTEKSLLLKLQALLSRGASSSELVEVVSTAPKILAERRAKATGLYYDFIRDILQSDKKDSGKSSTLCDSLLACKQGNRIRNTSLLRDLGVPQRCLFELLLCKGQPVSGKEKFEESVNKVVEMGFDPTSSKFVRALHVVYGISEKTKEEKVNVYKRLGFSVVEVWEIFKKWPYSLKFSGKKITQTFETLKKFGLVEDEVIAVMKKRPEVIRVSEEKLMICEKSFLGLGFSREEFLVIFKCYPTIGLSEEIVSKKVEFLVKEMGWSLQDILVVPPVVGYSLEKRIKPRCNVIKALMVKGLIRGGNEIPPMSSVLVCKDQLFLKRFVLKHDDKLVSELKAIFTKGRDGVSLTKRPSSGA